MGKHPAIISLEDYDESSNILVYGDSGIGKTVFAGGAGLIIGTEKGTISAKRQGSSADLWKADNWDQVRAAAAWLKKNPKEYDWVAIDSASEMQELALRWILAREFKNNPNRDPDIPHIQDHQKWQNMFKRFIRAFCDMPVNVLFTALPLRVETEEGDDLILPSFHGKGYGISSWVCAQMSVVAYIKKIRVSKTVDNKKVAEDRRRFYFQLHPLKSGGSVFAKDRYDVFGKYKDDLTLSDMSALIFGENESPKSPGKSSVTASEANNKAVENEDSESEDFEDSEAAQIENTNIDNQSSEDDDLDELDDDEDDE